MNGAGAIAIHLLDCCVFSILENGTTEKPSYGPEFLFRSLKDCLANIEKKSFNFKKVGRSNDSFPWEWKSFLLNVQLSNATPRELARVEFYLGNPSGGLIQNLYGPIKKGRKVPDPDGYKVIF